MPFLSKKKPAEATPPPEPPAASNIVIVDAGAMAKALLAVHCATHGESEEKVRQLWPRVKRYLGAVDDA